MKERVENLRQVESVKNWFTKGNKGKGYTPATEKVYQGYMRLFCQITRRTPDGLLLVNSNDLLKVQQRIAKVMKTLGLRDHSATFRINALHSFWEANGLEITEPLRSYKGTPWLLRSTSKRQSTE